MKRPPRALRWAVAGIVLLTVLVVDGRASAAPADITVGVLSSQSSKNFSAGIPAHPYAQGTDVAGREAAAMQWATTNGYNVVSLSDADLENPTALAAVDVVILPYTWAMTPAASLTVRNWIQQGGALIPILASPRVFLDQGVWKLWVLELNYEAWEWGPLSEAYQMMFVNDPSPSSWQATLKPGHPIVTDTLADLGLTTATLTRPAGSGVEFGYKYNTNVTSILDYAAVASPFSGYNGYSAAQATHYGSGRIVYFDIPVLDFLPYYNPVLAAQPVGGGHDHGELVDSLLNSAVEWAVNGGGYGPILRAATTWGEVDAYGTAIYIRQWATATGNVPVSGTLTAKVYNPAGVLVSSKEIAALGIEPGRTHMYNWSYIKGSTLDDGLYRVVLEYRYSYPEYTLVSTAEAYVQRGQGAGATTVPVAATSSEPISLAGDFDGNGSTDLSLYSPFDGKWWVLESDGSGFEPAQWADFSSAAGWEARLAGDFNGDGKDDIAQFHPSNGTWWISQSTGSSFATALWADFATASGWEARLAGDFNGDGKDDIAQFHPSNGTWWISQSTGTGFSTKLWADFTTATGWTERVVGDFNGDGKDDIAQFHPGNGTWWISRSNGSSFTTELWADFTTASGWQARLVGDYNGDGKDDIAQFHPGNGTWWISKSTGTTFSTGLWADFTTASGWQARMVGDYDGDGKDDIAQFHPSNGTWWISKSNGTTLATSLWADFSTPSGWSHRKSGDFNGDGKDDIVQAALSNGTWWVSKSLGSTFQTTNWATFLP